ncbi:MAG: hypothetical protein V7K18_13480 [Nostoc sp.]|uniref:hypothetical protein n=1 Tax=Nostoc sp. TaxID=1180 RepID=UPI002FF6F85F
MRSLFASNPKRSLTPFSSLPIATFFYKRSKIAKSDRTSTDRLQAGVKETLRSIINS